MSENELKWMSLELKVKNKANTPDQGPDYYFNYIQILLRFLK